MRLLVYVAALWVAGCSGRKPATPAAPDAAPVKVAVPLADAAPVARARTLELEEVKAVLPVPAESRVINAHEKAPGQERVNVAFCFDRLSIEQAAERVSEKLVAAGWQVQRAGAEVHATHGDLHLDGMVRRGPWEGCLGTKQQTYVALGVYR
jgi:hypothetical protein